MNESVLWILFFVVMVSFAAKVFVHTSLLIQQYDRRYGDVTRSVIATFVATGLAFFPVRLKSGKYRIINIFWFIMIVAFIMMCIVIGSLNEPGAAGS